jgi:putative membrane protein insertion efficiency factor
MPWIRRYPGPYDDPYDYRRWGRRPPGNPGGSCLRDSCLLETGCCLGEAIDGNCLVAGLLLVPQFLLVTRAATRAPAPTGKRGKAALLAAIRLYQEEISARRGPCCRFTPSCSQYAADAIDKHGATRGTRLAVRRLLRCRPGGRRGADPVPA